MRTTLNIDEEALTAVKEYAEQRGVSLGQATSDLIHRAVETLPKFKTKNGWALLEVPPGTPPLTNEDIEAIENLEYQEEYRRAISPRR